MAESAIGYRWIAKEIEYSTTPACPVLGEIAINYSRATAEQNWRNSYHFPRTSSATLQAVRQLEHCPL
jgi:hypothetical protein